MTTLFTPDDMLAIYVMRPDIVDLCIDLESSLDFDHKGWRKGALIELSARCVEVREAMPHIELATYTPDELFSSIIGDAISVLRHIALLPLLFENDETKVGNYIRNIACDATRIMHTLNKKDYEPL